MRSSSNDTVLLEATNGLTTVGPIRLEIDIIPRLLPLKVKVIQNGRCDRAWPSKGTILKSCLILQVSDLTLDEGSSLPLTPDIIMVDSHHFSVMDFLYQIVVPPRHGHLEHIRIPGMPITAFTHTEVRVILL